MDLPLEKVSKITSASLTTTKYTSKDVLQVGKYIFNVENGFQKRFFDLMT